MPQTVSIVLPSFGPIGVVRAMFRLGAGLWSEGVTVDLVVLSGAHQPPFAPPDGIRLTCLDARNPLRAGRELAAYLRRRRPDAVLAASNPAALSTLRAQQLSEVQTRVVITLRTQLTALWQQERGSIPQKMVESMRHLYPRAHALAAVSTGVADDLARLLALPRERFCVIYNGIDIPDCLRRAALPGEHPWLDVEGGPPLLLGVGRLGPQKDFPTLLRAFAQVRAQRPARLMILGDGRQTRALKEQAAQLQLGEDLALPGFVENPLPYMRAASVFVLSSAFEGLPNVVLEALAVGTPVVSTDCPSGPHELLDGGLYGPLVPVGDADALAAAICRTLDAPLSRERLMQRAGAFSVERMVAGYLNVLLGDGRKPALQLRKAASTRKAAAVGVSAPSRTACSAVRRTSAA